MKLFVICFLNYIMKSKECKAMYISVKTMRIIAAILFAILVYINFSIDQNEEIPDSIKRKAGNISFVIVIIGAILGTVLGIFESAD